MVGCSVVGLAGLQRVPDAGAATGNGCNREPFHQRFERSFAYKLEAGKVTFGLRSIAWGLF